MTSVKATTVNRNGEDQISRLPDEIIGQILSLLPTRNAVVTSVLSKRWRYLWTNITHLSFEDDYNYIMDPWVSFASINISIQSKSSFHDSVDKALHQCRWRQIERFHLNSRRVGLNQAEAWINEAVQRNVHELDLWLMEVPFSCVFACKSLTLLKLHVPSDSVGFPDKLEISDSWLLPSLKTFHLRVSCLSSNVVEKFLHSCPALEDLSLRSYSVKDNSEFNFSAPSLKRLIFCFFKNDSNCKILINAPNLMEIRLHNGVVVDCKVENLSSIAKAQFGFESWEKLDNETICNRVLKLLAELSNVEWLLLGSYTMKALGMAYCKHRLPRFRNLTRLESFYGKPDDWRVLLHLLQVSPKLRVLIWKKPFYKVNLEYAFDWNEPENVPECLSSCLQLVGIEGGIVGNGCELKMVEYLFQHAAVLKKLVVDVRESAPEITEELYQKLFKIRIRSSQRRIVFIGRAAR